MCWEITRQTYLDEGVCDSFVCSLVNKSALAQAGLSLSSQQRMIKLQIKLIGGCIHLACCNDDGCHTM
jgi:hypothetical protein